jgi:hypothetical protein
MSTAELKQEAIKEIEKLDSDEALKYAVEFLHALNKQVVEKPDMKDIFDKAVKDYGNVLEKLAK